MAESAENRVGKFTILENTESETSQIFGPEAASKEARSESAEDSVDAFTVKTKQATRRKTAREPKAKPVVQAFSEAPANYHLWSQLFISSTNTVVVTWLGSECAMEKREADMLEPPVARLLARLTPAQSEQISKFVDPMVILIALGMWGNRIIRIQRGKRQTISPEELARASGVVSPPPQEPPTYQQPVEPEIPVRKIEVNPNGIPTAITSQMGEV